ncbi:ribbon-helix-helix domain-containing protein [Azospirillum brasilense]|nr:ribbon-helix-helix domain-containing protein [Azospirillum brasilense]
MGFMDYVVVGPDGELMLPKAVRDQLGLKPGDCARIDVDPVHHHIAALSRSNEPLASRSIMVGGHRTSMRLEPAMWDALEDIARREGLTVNTLCTQIKDRLEEQLRRHGPGADNAEVTLTSAVRVFIAAYFRRCVLDQKRGQTEPSRPDPFSGTPFELSDAMTGSAAASSGKAQARKTIDDLIGMGGTIHRSVSVEEMNEAVRRRAAQRFLKG